MLEKEFNFFKEHKDELQIKYLGKTIVIKNEEVVGVYATEAEALQEASKKFELGTFLIQQISAKEKDYIQRFHSRVSFRWVMKHKTTHRAFRTEFRGRIVREIVTPAYVEAPSALAHTGSEKQIKVNAIWDTGATDSVITKSIVKQLALVPTGRTIVRGVNSEMEVFTFFVNIGLPNRVMIENVKVTECELNSPGIDILIGMNII